MNFILRIINQNLNETQVSRNIPLENGYSVVSKINNRHAGSGKTHFEQSVENYFEGIPHTELEKANVVMIVHDMSGKNPSNAILNHEVAYIVNENGQTVERLHGMFIKY